MVHVAGTNGKGSTIAFVRAMAEADGKTCHVLTSPHLISFAERVVVTSQPVGESLLAQAIDHVLDVNGAEPITFFEITTAAALHMFATHGADLCLLEVGLGGRVDATNVVGTPACTAITPIGYDHQAFLGDTLAKIAFEKSGIMRRDVPVIVGPQDGEARASIVTEAQQCGALVQIWGSDYRAYLENGRMTFETEDALLDLPPPGMVGQHQVINAGVAVAVARQIGVSDDAIARGVAEAHWPGRLHRVTTGPLAERCEAVNRSDVWVDGAHNELGARALAQALADMGDAAPRPVVLVLGMQAKKDPEAFLKPLAGLIAGVVAVPLNSGVEYWSPDELAGLAGELLLAPAALVDDLVDAPHMARQFTRPNQPYRLVITGSLHLVGEALSLGGRQRPTATPG